MTRRASIWGSDRPARRRGVVTLLGLALAAVYLGLMAWSSSVRMDTEPRAEGTPRGASAVLVSVPRVDRGVRLDAPPMGLRVLKWTKPVRNGPDRDPGLPVVLLHGSPGSANNFGQLGPKLTEAPRTSPLDPSGASRGGDRVGRDVYAFDLPGFGDSSAWIPDYSVRSAAVALLDALDGLGVERAHVVGWSNGGGVGLELAALAPDRVASLTLLASIGLQETEGSGSYWFEHAKYAAGYAALVVGFELVPHFGVLGEVSGRHTFLRSFFDTDQRRLAPIMADPGVPVFILHGRTDFLTPAWGAWANHRAVPGSALVMLESDHFLPMAEPANTAAWLGPFLARHDTPEPVGPAPYAGATDLSVQTGFRDAVDAAGAALRVLPWWLQGVLLAMLGRAMPRWALALAATLVGVVQLDIALAWVALASGRLSRRARTPGRLRHALWAFLAPGVGVCVFFVAIHLNVAPALDRSAVPGWLGLVLICVGVRVAVVILGALPTGRRQRRFVRSWRRAFRHEFWPAWALYGPVLARIVWLMWRHRSVRLPTRCNPAMTRLGSVAGGLAFDRKSAVLEAFGDDPRVLSSAGVDPEPRGTLGERLAAAAGRLGGLPVVIKPETGERGRGVAVVRTPDELRDAAEAVRERTVVQRFHPGPVECGVFWVRTPEGGRVFSVTRKLLPVVVGDGARTVGQLVRRDPELRLREETLERESGARWSAVPGPGERVPVSEVANHARGAIFRDGADLITPELERAVRSLADRLDALGGFDFGRFDLRSSSDEALRAGRDLGLIEVNGLASESTNLYDRTLGARRAWRILGDQWAEAFGRGRLNAEAGVPPASWRSLAGAGVCLLLGITPAEGARDPETARPGGGGDAEP